MMFTIKYRFYTLASKQPQEGPSFYDQNESCHGPFEVVSQVRDEYGYIVVHGITPNDQMTFGPETSRSGVTDRPKEDPSAPRPTVWVMNENGATIAKYDL